MLSRNLLKKITPGTKNLGRRLHSTTRKCKMTRGQIEKQDVRTAIKKEEGRRREDEETQ